MREKVFSVLASPTIRITREFFLDIGAGLEAGSCIRGTRVTRTAMYAWNVTCSRRGNHNSTQLLLGQCVIESFSFKDFIHLLVDLGHSFFQVLCCPHSCCCWNTGRDKVLSIRKTSRARIACCISFGSNTKLTGFVLCCNSPCYSGFYLFDDSS
jgi:hypothetical protein